MSRHPEYDGRYPTLCCEEAPDLYGFGITLACSLRAGHCGDHEACSFDTVLQRWPSR